MAEEKEIEKVIVRLVTNHSDGVRTVECRSVSIDDDFINMELYDNSEEDLLSIKKDLVQIISSKKIYKGDE